MGYCNLWFIVYVQQKHVLDKLYGNKRKIQMYNKKNEDLSNFRTLTLKVKKNLLHSCMKQQFRAPHRELY